MRRFANGDGVCQCCASVFSTRLRLIAHLSDARRPACRDWILLNGTPLDEVRVSDLDASDRKSRSEARKLGLTQPKSAQPAVNSHGKQIGRVHG
jgi:hypothetical protein